MLKNKQTYTTLNGKEYHLLQIKDFIPYINITFREEDLDNWVCCREGERISSQKFSKLKDALIQIELRNDLEMQKYIIFKDEERMMQRYLHIKEEITIRVEEYLHKQKKLI